MSRIAYPLRRLEQAAPKGGAGTIKGNRMKYLLLIYGNPTNWIHPIFMHQANTTEAERAAMMTADEALMQEITESGELIEAHALTAPETTRAICLQNGVPAVTDGPFAEAKEQLAGVFILDCETPERAVEIASRFPDIRFGPVVVRQVMDFSGEEM